MIDLNKLCEMSLAAATQRMKNGASTGTDTRAMLKRCAAEVVEAAEAHERKTYLEENAPFNIDSNEYAAELHKEDMARFAGELADIICCVLIICGNEQIDVEQAILDCIEKSRKRAEEKGDIL